MQQSGGYSLPGQALQLIQIAVNVGMQVCEMDDNEL